MLPALTQASATPSLTRLMATRIDESFFLRIASAADSDIPTTSVAGRILSLGSLPTIRVTKESISSSSPVIKGTGVSNLINPYFPVSIFLSLKVTAVADLTSIVIVLVNFVLLFDFVEDGNELEATYANLSSSIYKF